MRFSCGVGARGGESRPRLRCISRTVRALKVRLNKLEEQTSFPLNYSELKVIYLHMSFNFVRLFIFHNFC